jgi:hypothetical protein
MINDLLAGVSSFQTNRRASSRFVAGQKRKLLQFVPQKVHHSTAEFFIKSPPSLTAISTTPALFSHAILHFCNRIDRPATEGTTFIIYPLLLDLVGFIA